jgi:hypothetical protein
VERTLSLDGSAPVVLDLCEVDDQLIQRVRVLMDRGAPVAKGKPGPKTGTTVNVWMTCPEPGCVGGGHGRAGLGMHTRRVHNKMLRDYGDAA